MSKPREFWIVDRPDGKGAHVFHRLLLASTYCEVNDVYDIDHVVEFSAYQKAIDALKRECCCTGETSHIVPHKKVLCDACETLRELGEIE